MITQKINFIRDKFDPMIAAGLFVFVFLVWIYGPVPESLSDKVFNLAQGLLYAFLALLGVRPRTGPAIQADNIEKASTDSGDILQTGAADPPKGQKYNDEQNKIPSD